MAPKAKTKKARKGKTSTVMEAPSNNELSKDQLWEEGLLRLQEELDRVREEKRNFQLERDKYQSAWEISKEELEDTEARVRFKRRQTEEGRERHRAEISDYQQRLKNMLAEQSNSVSDLKKLNVSSSLLLRNQITEREVELCKEYERLQAACRERKFLKETSVRNLELKHQEELMKMSRHYERQLRDVADTFEVRRKNLLQRKQTQIQSKISSLDKAIKARLDSLITDNLKKLGELQLAWDKEEEEEDPPSFEQQNKPLPKRKPPLRRKLLLEEKTEPEVQEKQFELQEPQQKHRLKDLMTLEQECSDLRRRGTESVLDIQQRSSVEEMRLQRRVAEMSEAVERTEVKLLSVLALTNTNQETRNDAAKRLQEIFESKQAQMDSMKQTLEGDCKEYDELLQTRKDKLRAAGVHSFPFKSAKTILKAAKPLPDILQATGCSTFNAHKQVM
uniref:Dynein regulatory complex subunit 4 n=1 Tax=Oryzias melastigma TaxID=30732 RepID=A0A3B3BZ61_ORYME